MSLPEVQETVGGYAFSWAEGIKIAISRIKVHTDGRIIGEIIVSTSAAGYAPHLYQAQFNFSAGRSRKELSKYLFEQSPKLVPRSTWNEILEQLCVNILDRIREGQPLQELWTNADIKAPEYLVYPILPKFQPTILYGDGGVGKSETCLLLATCLVLPWHDNKLGLIINSDKSVRVLYLDWESHSNIINWRLKCLRKGLGLPDYCINYLQCDGTFADSLPQIQRKVVEIGAECVIVDSMGGAVNGDLNDAQTATGLIQRHLRQLNASALLIGHVIKGGNGGEKTPFGSIFWRNAARSAWEVKASRPEKNVLEVGLFHRKANESQLFDPLGFRISFQGEQTVVTKTEVRDTGLASELPIVERIREVLRDGAKTNREITEELGIGEGSIKTILNRHKSLFVRTNPEGRTAKWGLLYEATT